jgi:hypothetical protein
LPKDAANALYRAIPDPGKRLLVEAAHRSRDEVPDPAASSTGWSRSAAWDAPELNLVEALWTSLEGGSLMLGLWSGQSQQPM